MSFTPSGERITLYFTTRVSRFQSKHSRKHSKTAQHKFDAHRYPGRSLTLRKKRSAIADPTEGSVYASRSGSRPRL